MRRSNFHTSVVFAVLAVASLPTWAGPPVLNNLPTYESPVHGDPDGLLLLSGSGLSAADTVVYEQYSGTSLQNPASVPTSSTATTGVADLVSSADAPYSLTVHLPAVMAPEQSYALWVVTPDGQWSNAAMINDARPLWITPDSGYMTASLANLPRQLKIIGRNLEPAPTGSGVTRVELIGENTGSRYHFVAKNTSNDPTGTTADSERYIAVVNLPSSMAVDQYAVEVQRDSQTWVPLLGNGQSPAQLFTVNSDPNIPPTPISVADFAGPVSGPCLPNDSIDDTACIILAIRAAQAAGGGTVSFGPGTWQMLNPGTFPPDGVIFTNITGNNSYADCNNTMLETCGVSYDGVLVPPNVNLQGAGSTGSSVTTIERGTGWFPTAPLFTVQGNNTVSGFMFTDDNAGNYTASSSGGSVLQLGLEYDFARRYSPTDPVTLSNVVITDNLFDNPFFAITNGALPADHIYITNNTFGGAWNAAIDLVETEANVQYLVTPSTVYPYVPYTFSDTIIDNNTFYPSSFQQTAATYNGGGSLATQISTGLRSDFSNNVADGSNTQYLQTGAGSTPVPGWRAAFFWSSGAGQDMTLVSDNTIYCAGDKYGNGEGIVYDGSYSAAQMATAQPVVSATAWTDPQQIAGTALTVQGTVNTTVDTFDISGNPGPFYQGAWVQIIGGMGKGQWRKLETLALGSNAAGSTVTLYVTPAFSVPPDATSVVDVNRAYWQNTTVNNFIDQRTPLCTKKNALLSGGDISWYDSTADSVIAGNQQFDTTGIILNHSYHPLQPGAAWSTAGAVIQSANEIRDNTIDGAYAWSSRAGVQAGIYLGYGAPENFCNSGNNCTAPSPPVLGYGETIAGNTLFEASGRDVDAANVPVGAIGLGPNWNTGPLDVANASAWQMGDAALIFDNTLQNISNTISGSAGGLPLVGIGLDSAQGSTASPPVNWRSSLYANTCSTVDTPLANFGTSSVRYCPNGSTTGTCECNGVATTDVGVAAASSVTSGSVNSAVTYTITVTNNGPAAATAVTLSMEPSAGLQVGTSAFATSLGSCDGSIRVCSLGNLASGSSATVTVTTTLVTTGAWPATFSVTHQDTDPVPANNSATTTVTAM